MEPSSVASLRSATASKARHAAGVTSARHVGVVAVGLAVCSIGNVDDALARASDTR